ncbi:MAG: homocysteine S-methyltransferase family protein [Bacillota bacterium]|nr:homocysteine S-methyltransferase family protein [Bacillota bacterium]
MRTVKYEKEEAPVGSQNKTVILDGAMGTMLQRSGMKPGQIPEELNIDRPGMVIDVHRKYIAAGAQVIYTCTFGANRKKLRNYVVSQVVAKAIENARLARGHQDIKIALDIGPLGEMLEPLGTLKFEEAYELFREIIEAGRGADAIVIETMTDLYEVRAAVLAARENSSLPIFVTMSFEEDGRTFAGVSLETFVNSIAGLGVAGIGINCSLGPLQMYDMVKKLVEMTDLDIVIKPNAGMPRMDGSYDLAAPDFAAGMEKIQKLGVKYVGGCCGTDEAYIRLLAERVRDQEVAPRNIRKISGVSSATRFLQSGGIRVVGERLNPTGKKRYQQALIDGDVSYIVGQAVEQVDGGADILDLNVGFPGVDEAGMLRRLVKEIQAVLDTPLQLDSTRVEALEAALRVYNGRAIVNSVNGEDDSLEGILPLVKKYHAQVIGLTLDKRGIPDTAEERLAIAEKIVRRAADYGIPKEDIYIDCLALTVSSQPEAAMETLEAIRLVKKQLGVKTVLGVSNISFGLPNREAVNQSFLTLALYEGLDLAIINPNSRPMMEAIRSYKVLRNLDGATEDFIRCYGNVEEKSVPEKTEDHTIASAVAKGLDQVVKAKVRQLLGTMDELAIVDRELVPALDQVGRDYESGRIFLPQLIKAAGAAQAGFALIRDSISQKGRDSISKGDVIVATVKGDVHDIGKNIAKVMMESYGYNVIDLGKDVEAADVVRTAKERNIRLVGLSALMTTTLDNMRETIAELKKEIPDICIMVGGAVLTEEYSREIGADYYVKDARADVEVARKVFGC